MNCIPSNPLARAALITAANTGVATAISTPAFATGAIFGAISAPVALAIFKLGQMFVHSRIDRKYDPIIIRRERNEPPSNDFDALGHHAKIVAKKKADVILALVATVSSVALTILFVNAIGFNLSIGMGCAFGAPMVALTLLYTLSRLKSNHMAELDAARATKHQSVHLS